VYGASDEFSYNGVKNPLSVHDVNATILHLLGVDHARLKPLLALICVSRSELMRQAHY
jgi:hypothetical protein